MELQTCWTLVQDAARGAVDARQRFSTLYVPIIQSALTARWRGRANSSDVDDAVQEVILDCLREDGVLERAVSNARSGFRAYLHGAIRNVALRFEERRAKRVDRPGPETFDASVMQLAETSMSQAFDRAWAVALVGEAAARMRADAQAIGSDAARRVELLELRFAEDLPVREIAKRWDVDTERVHREYSKARDDFRVALRTVVQFQYPDEAGEAIDRRCVDLMGHLE